MAEWLALIIIGVLLALVCKLYLFLLPYSLIAETFLGYLMLPVDILADQIFSRKSVIPGSRFIRCFILLAVLIGSVAFIVSSFASGITLDQISDSLLSDTSLGQLLALFGEERFGSPLKEQFTFSSLVSMGISSFLSFLYMRCTLDTIEDFDLMKPLMWLLIIPFNLAYMCISTLLSAPIAGICVAASEKLSALWLTLTGTYQSGGVLTGILTGIALFLLGLCGLWALILCVREVLAAFTYGFMSLLLVLVVGMSLSAILAFFPGAPMWIMNTYEILVDILIPIAMFLPDYLRASDFFRNNVTFLDLV